LTVEKGEKHAEERPIPVVGTLSVLQEAATLGLLDLRVAVEPLQTTSFYFAPEVLRHLLNDKVLWKLRHQTVVLGLTSNL
jgi:hypothetical protein